MNLAQLMAQTGRGQGEIDYLRRAIATDPSHSSIAGAYANLGCAIGDVRDPARLEEELGCYEKAIELKPVHCDHARLKLLASRPSFRFSTRPRNCSSRGTAMGVRWRKTED